ncbi:hypothetical protein B0H17DRAFT_1203782 [Mycena rosella]|uniref:Uncharacterized protein n=1 Tax=Mycena rosella TaxID=1033263 RepID=A0AAD7DAM2_MYCRO|nr:hypothetical protein B0H17DRAFT_1203782 [Mycena rosella]
MADAGSPSFAPSISFPDLVSHNPAEATCARVLDTLTAAINKYPPHRNQGLRAETRAPSAEEFLELVLLQLEPSLTAFLRDTNKHWPTCACVADFRRYPPGLKQASAPLAIAPHEHLPAVLACILIIVNPLHTAEHERVPRMHVPEPPLSARPASFAQEASLLAADVNERLTASSASSAAEPEAATFLRRSLSQLGLQMADASVMQGHGERRAALDAQLAGVLRGLTRNPGVIALVEVWGGWNRRAASVRLFLSPLFAMLMARDSAPPPVDTPPSSRAPPTIHGPRDRRVHLPSGLRVLHTPPYARPAFSARLT